MKVKEENEKAGLKLNIQRTKNKASRCHHFMANGEKWKQANLIFLDSKVSVDDDCSHKIKTHLLLGRKAMTAY